MDKTLTVLEVVNKLIGDITPIGASHIDDKRYENLEAMIGLMKELHMQIDLISHQNKDRQEYSRRKAGKYCDDYISKWLGMGE